MHMYTVHTQTLHFYFFLNAIWYKQSWSSVVINCTYCLYCLGYAASRACFLLSLAFVLMRYTETMKEPFVCTKKWGFTSTSQLMIKETKYYCARHCSNCGPKADQHILPGHGGAASKTLGICHPACSLGFFFDRLCKC